MNTMTSLTKDLIGSDAFRVMLYVLAGFLIVRVGLRILDRSLRARPRYPSRGVHEALRNPASVLVVLWVVEVCAPMPRALQITIQLSLLVTLAFVLLRAIGFVFAWLHNIFDISGTDNLRSRRIRTQLEFLHRLVALFVIVLGVSLALVSFESGRRLGTSILASAGVASVVIGLAAQRSLSNLIAGFQIAFTQPIRIDDAIVVENEWGWVEEINLTYVVVRLWDRRRLVLPINYFIENPFQNWTRNSAQILGAVHLHVGFEVPFEKLESEFFRLLDECPLWDGEARVLQVVEAHERTAELRMLMTARDSPTAFDLRCYIRRHMIDFIRREFPDTLPSLRITDTTLRPPAHDTAA